MGTQEQMGSADPPGKMDKKLKSENMQKRAVFWMGVGLKWYEWLLVGQADDYYYCYYYWSLPFFTNHEYPSSSMFYEDPQIQ